MAAQNLRPEVVQEVLGEMGFTGMHKALPGREVCPEGQGWQFALPPTLKENVLAGH